MTRRRTHMQLDCSRRECGARGAPRVRSRAGRRSASRTGRRADFFTACVVAALWSGATGATAGTLDLPEPAATRAVTSPGPADAVRPGRPSFGELGKRPLGAPEPSNRHQARSDIGGPADSGPSLLRTFGSLVGVLVVILLLAHVAKRLLGRKQAVRALGGTRSPAGVLEILGRYPIAPGVTVLLLKMGRRVLLLSQCGGGVLPLRRGGPASLGVLCEVSDAEEVASILACTRDAEGESIAAKFRELLSTYAGRGEGDEETSGPAPRAPRDAAHTSATTPAGVTTRPLAMSAAGESRSPARSGSRGVEVKA